MSLSEKPQWPSPSVARHYSEHTTLSNLKKSHLSVRLALAGKSLVEAPLLLPDGKVLNWHIGLKSGSTCPSTARCKPGNNPSGLRNGQDALNPIDITESDEDNNLTLITSRLAPSSTISSCSNAALPRHSTHTVKSELTPITIDSSSCEEDDVEVTYRVMERCPEDLNLDFRDSILILRCLPLDVRFNDITRLLKESCFSSSVVREIVIFPNQTASVQFVHRHLADAAFVVWDGMDMFSRKGRRSVLHVERCPAPELPILRPRVSSACPDSNVPKNFSLISQHESHPDISALYGALRQDVYEDEDEERADEDEAGSSSLEERSLPPIFPEDVQLDIALTGMGGQRQSASLSDSDSDWTVPRDFRDPSQKGTHVHAKNNKVSKRRVVTAPDISRPSPPTIRPSKRRSSGRWASSQPSDRDDSDSDLQARRPSRKRAATSRHFHPVESSSVGLPVAPYNRARRVLVPSSPGLPIATISMRADAQFVDPDKRFRKSSYSLPFRDPYRHVDDACIVGDTVIVGYSKGPYEISLIPIQKDVQPQFVDLIHKPHKPKRDSSQGGVSCLAPVPERKFLSGGHDKSIRIWTINHQNLATATSEQINVLSTVPYALAYRDWDRTVIYSYGHKLSTMNLKRLAVQPKSIKLSNKIHHIHVHSEAKNLTILELDHLDSQVHIFDDRNGGFDRAPDLQFGYRHGGRGSRYTRGGVDLARHFVRGYPDGTVKIWDYRNTKIAVVEAQHHRAEAVVHTIFLRSDILAYGDKSLSFLNLNGEEV